MTPAGKADIIAKLKNTKIKFNNIDDKNLDLGDIGKNISLTKDNKDIIDESTNGWNQQWFTSQWINTHPVSYPLHITNTVNYKKDLLPTIIKNTIVTNDDKKLYL